MGNFQRSSNTKNEKRKTKHEKRNTKNEPVQRSSPACGFVAFEGPRRELIVQSVLVPSDFPVSFVSALPLVATPQKQTHNTDNREYYCVRRTARSRDIVSRLPTELIAPTKCSEPPIYGTDNIHSDKLCWTCFFRRRRDSPIKENDLFVYVCLCRPFEFIDLPLFFCQDVTMGGGGGGEVPFLKNELGREVMFLANELAGERCIFERSQRSKRRNHRDLHQKCTENDTNTSMCVRNVS